MEFGIFTIIHAVLAVFLIIELGLTAYCMSHPSNRLTPQLTNMPR